MIKITIFTIVFNMDATKKKTKAVAERVQRERQMQSFGSIRDKQKVTMKTQKLITIIISYTLKDNMPIEGLIVISTFLGTSNF